ncbi:MAG: MmgE/PrpD family protein [Micropruina sp.]
MRSRSSSGTSRTAGTDDRLGPVRPVRHPGAPGRRAADTVRRAGLHLLDTLGAALAGSASVEAGLARRAARAEGGLGTGPAAIWGTAGRACPQTAAFVNGVAAHAFELDDSGGCDHSGAVVVPAALAAVAVAGRPVTGAELTSPSCSATSSGAGCRPPSAATTRSTSAAGTPPACAARSPPRRPRPGARAGRRGAHLGDRPGRSFTGGTWAFVDDSAMSKRLHVGRAAECGLHAALLAREGFTGPAAVFEAGWGGVLGLYAGPGVADPAAISGGLGEHWQLDRSSIKPYASCRSTHSTIDAVLRLREQGLRAERVDALEVHASELIVQMCGGADLSSLVSAQLSLPFAVAVAAVRGDVGLDDILAGRTDPGCSTCWTGSRCTPTPASTAARPSPGCGSPAAVGASPRRPSGPRRGREPAERRPDPGQVRSPGGPPVAR